MTKKILTLITKKNFKKLFIILLLLLPPLIFCTAWYLFEYEEKNIFTNLEVKGAIITLNNPEEITALTGALYNYTKDEYPVKFEKTGGISEFENFKLEVSEKLIGNIGIFSSLPIYKVCLDNQNKIFLNGQIQKGLELSKGAASVKQENGYEFYARRGEKDCKNVLISKFRNSRSRVEYGYIISTTINTYEESKFMKGEKFSINIEPSFVDSSETKITVSLSMWVLLLSYTLTLFAWSFIFFQYEKIFNYIFQKSPKH